MPTHSGREQRKFLKWKVMYNALGWLSILSFLSPTTTFSKGFPLELYNSRFKSSNHRRTSLIQPQTYPCQSSKLLAQLTSTPILLAQPPSPLIFSTLLHNLAFPLLFCSSYFTQITVIVLTSSGYGINTCTRKLILYCNETEKNDCTRITVITFTSSSFSIRIWLFLSPDPKRGKSVLCMTIPVSCLTCTLFLWVGKLDILYGPLILNT